MSNKEKRSNLPECGCRGCNLKVNRPRKYNCTKLDEATDVNTVRARLRGGFRCSSLECSCDGNGENISTLRGNAGTFIKFTGPTSESGRIINPAAPVMPSNSNIRSTSGCFLEKSSDGKSRAFELESNDVSENAPSEYFRSVTIWQGVLNKRLNVRTTRSSKLATRQADRSQNGFMPSEYNFYNDKSHAAKNGSCKNEFHRRPEVGRQRCYQNLNAALFSFDGMFLFLVVMQSTILEICLKIGLVFSLCRFDLEIYVLTRLAY